MPQVPAKRYDLFIKAFEKQVEKAQQAIKLMDRLSGIYDICRVALERAALENETKLELEAAGVYVTIRVLDDDREGFCRQLLNEIGAELKRLKLHYTGAPASGTARYNFYYKWRLISFTPTVTVQVRLDVPLSGTKYIKVIETRKPITVDDVSRELVWVNEAISKPIVTDEIPF